MLNGSVWSTEKNGTCDRLRKEEAARITDENAKSEDHRHTSGGVFVAVDSILGAVAGTEEGAVESIPGNEGRIAQTWVNVRGGTRVVSVAFGTLTVDGHNGPSVTNPTVSELEHPSSASQDDDGDDMDFSSTPRKSRLSAPQLQAQLHGCLTQLN